MKGAARGQAFKSPRRIKMSEIASGDRLPVVAHAQLNHGDLVDSLLDEVDRPVEESEIAAARVIRLVARGGG